MPDWNQAGHYFIDGIRCACGRYWADIRNTQRGEIGQHGIAHTTYLSEGEYASIEKRRNAEDNALANAMTVVSGRRIQDETAAVRIPIQASMYLPLIWPIDYNDLVEF